MPLPFGFFSRVTLFALAIEFAFFGNVVKGKHALFRFVAINGFALRLKKVLGFSASVSQLAQVHAGSE